MNPACGSGISEADDNKLNVILEDVFVNGLEILAKIKGKIAELAHWMDKQETKAEVDTLIGKMLWEELLESYSVRYLHIDSRAGKNGEYEEKFLADKSWNGFKDSVAREVVYE